MLVRNHWMGRGLFFPSFSRNAVHYSPGPGIFFSHLLRLLPLSPAVHIFSFLQARISSAGHQHSFSTGSLCLDIPTPPSVLYGPVLHEQNQLLDIVTQGFGAFFPYTVTSVRLFSYWSCKRFKTLSCHMLKRWTDLRRHMSCTNIRMGAPGRGVAVAGLWSRVHFFCTTDYLLWGFVRR